MKFLGVIILKEDHNILRFEPYIYMYKFIDISNYILIQCHGNYMEMKTINDMLETDVHFVRFLTKEFGCPEGWFLRVWVSKKTPAG